MSQTSPNSSFAGLPLALLRIAVGWHFLYEGFTKLSDPLWSAEKYLQGSSWFFADFFHWLASDPTRLRVVDELNIWGLMLIGLCLMLGLLSRFSAVMGVLLLAFYYVAYPPLFATAMPAVSEGSYLIVNKVLIELLSLCVIVAFPASFFGLDGMLFGVRAARPAPDGEPAAHGSTPNPSRRVWLTSLVGVPFLGGLALAVLKKHGWQSIEELQLTRLQQAGEADASATDGSSGATLKSFEFTGLDQLRGEMQYGRIKDLELSRVILGGNLIGGWAHARDLIYVSKLVKAYHHKWKIFETFQLAEKCGVNTILTNPLLCDVISEYWKTTGGEIQFISDCGGKDLIAMTQKSIDNGASACYIQGGIADRLVEQEQFDLIEQTLQLIRDNNLPAGIGAHKLATVQACVDRGFDPDFWMKTLHHTNYWSAQPEQQHDNIWCEQPEQTVEYMKGIAKPWIAFKTLAAGAIPPKVGFKYAFKNGADFICVGMYDFQLVEDVNLAMDVLTGDLPRQRDWMA